MNTVLMGQNELNSVPEVVDTLTILGYSRWQSWYVLYFESRNEVTFVAMM